MISKWFELKSQAITLRQKGSSIRRVEKLLKIPRSTLSGWFKSIELTEKQKNKLKEDWLKGLNKARTKAVIWHRYQKESRLKTAEQQAKKVLTKLDLKCNKILELALSLLYLGEGFKSSSGTGLGNSDPLILNFFINSLEKCFGIGSNKIKCELHLRADQKPSLVKKYWSKELDIPLKNFTSVSIDKRTIGSPTYPTYNGVCILRCGSIAIQRELISLARSFCKEIINQRAVSSAGRAFA